MSSMFSASLWDPPPPMAECGNVLQFKSVVRIPQAFC